jgi:membrane protein YqaA with SNARE-associated domain
MLASLIQAAQNRPSRLMVLFRHLGAFGLFALAILDSSPLPTLAGPDILIVILVVTRGNPWYEYAAVATAGSVIGALLTFRVARRAGRAYLESKFGSGRVANLLRVFEQWGTGALFASTAVPFPFPTSVFFAAAGASNDYGTGKFLGVVGVGRAIRYSAIALVAHIYGRHIIRVLRHPLQYWGWLLVFAAVFAALIAGGILLNKRLDAAGEIAAPPRERIVA